MRLITLILFMLLAILSIAVSVNGGTRERSSLRRSSSSHRGYTHNRLSSTNQRNHKPAQSDRNSSHRRNVENHRLQIHRSNTFGRHGSSRRNWHPNVDRKQGLKTTAAPIVSTGHVLEMATTLHFKDDDSRFHLDEGQTQW